jgi:NAD(P)-dependent dehydrogenase (short-subunit alcohol dehydrogenase family)
MAGKYEGKTAVITGASTGIGLAAAQQFVREGGTAIITARSQAALDAAVKELGPKAIALQSDAAKLEDIDALASLAKSKFPNGVDFLFVNAGIAKFLPLEAVTPEFWDEQHDINVRGAYFTVQRFAPLLRSGAGVVLNTSVVDEKGMPGTSAYAASKAALRSLARTLASELVGKGIRVNAVSPGPISTPIYDKLGLPADARAGFEAQMREGNPMKRFGQSEEVARAALFLAFDASYTTGAELPVDGGLTQL